MREVPLSTVSSGSSPWSLGRGRAPYRGTSLIRNRTTLGPYSRPPQTEFRCEHHCGSNVIPRRARPGLAGLRPHTRSLERRPGVMTRDTYRCRALQQG